MIALEEAKKRQDALQAQGRRLLEEFRIVPHLQKLGEFHFEGSFAYGLMVKPDIDCRVYVDQINDSDVAELINWLVLNPKNVRLSYANNFLGVPKEGQPKGIYVHPGYLFEGTIWSMDIWFMRPEDELDVDNFHLGWHEKLTQPQKDSILLLKHQLKELGRYGGRMVSPMSFASADIYRAVKNDGVETIEQLEEWRKTHPFY